jgi:hypothetical protein
MNRPPGGGAPPEAEPVDDPGLALAGAWRRAGRSLGGGRWSEPCAVLWLQAGSWFADLRSPRGGSSAGNHPLDAAQAFTGQVSVEEDLVEWHHDLHSGGDGPGHRDRATVRQSGDLLLEEGAGYRERWRRISAAGSPWAVTERRRPGAVTDRLIRLGDFALSVSSYPAPHGTEMVRDQSAGWRVRRAVGAGGDGGDREGDSAPERSVLRVVRALASGSHLPPSWVLVAQGSTPRATPTTRRGFSWQ